MPYIHLSRNKMAAKMAFQWAQSVRKFGIWREGPYVDQRSMVPEPSSLLRSTNSRRHGRAY